MSQKKEPKKAIIDVTHPDDTAPSETSRPIIVKNRGIIKDPMMVDESTSEADKSTKNEAPVEDESEDTHKIEVKTTVIKPVVSEEVVASEAEEKPEEAPAATPEAPAEEESDSPVATTESFSDDNGNVLKDPNKDEDQLEQEAFKHEEENQKLVDSKKYYLPINSLEKRRTHKVVVLGTILSIVLGLLWLNIALDAELINLGSIEALTDFF